MSTTPDGPRLTTGPAYSNDLTRAVATLITLGTDATFQRELTARLTTRIDISALRVLRTISWQRIHRPAELARELGVTRSQMTKALDRLEAEELVSRARDTADGRGVIVLLTPAGELTAQAMYEIGDRFFTAVVSDWDSADVATLTALLDRFVGDTRAAMQRLHRAAGPA